MKPDSWINGGTAMARRLLDAGWTEEAAGVLACVEREALRGCRRGRPASKLGRAVALLKREPNIAYWAARERIGISRGSWQRAKQLAREAA